MQRYHPQQSQYTNRHNIKDMDVVVEEEDAVIMLGVGMRWTDI